MAGVSIWIVDAFTDRPFAGNPAAVCLLEQERDAGWMQVVASEMNLSETAFLRRAANGFELRWFTPAIEVDLCGHATLASAHALWTAGAAAANRPIHFQTRSGLLTATRREALIELDFPATPVQACDLDPTLSAALGIVPTLSAKSRFDGLLLLPSAAEVRALRPDFRKLAEVPCRGLIVTAQSDEPAYDFISRFFAPAAGIDEDPVTGSAHCALGPFWADRLGKQDLIGYQASKRGGIVHVGVRGDRVLLSGSAVLVSRGELVC